MSLGQFLSILRARWLAALLMLLATVALIMGISLLLPRQYTAAAAVVVDFKPDPVSAAMYGGLPPPALMATQVDIMKSERVAERVVRNLKLAENPMVRQQWQSDTGGQGRIETWLATVFLRNVDIEPSRESSVIRVSYQSPDPRFSAALANAFVQAYIDTVLELRVNPARQYSAFFESRSREAREKLEQAQSRLSAFQAKNGIVATDERFDVENARLNELSSQFTALQALAVESGSRERQATGGQGERLSEVLNSPLIGALKADVNRAEASLQQLGTRLGDAHPQVQEARAHLAELRDRLRAETARITGGVTVTNRINNQRQADIRAALDAQRNRVLQLKAVRDEGLVLQREVDNAQRSYDAVLQRFTQTSLESQTTQSHVNVLTQAVPPLEPSSPKLVINALVALLLGLLLSVLTALFLELRDRRVRTLDDAVATLGLPVIGTLPKPGSRLSLGTRHSHLQHQLLRPLPQPAQGGA